MDCEKFESHLIDELYGELDDVTSAAMKRHASGCSRCSGLLGGLRATRKVAVLPLEPVPEGLEDRILSAARSAEKVVPIGSKFSRFVSRAGAWAMRPQTAMAAVFLLAIGSSVVLMNTRRDQARVAVEGQGAPADIPAAAGASAAAETVTTTLADNNAHGTLPAATRVRMGNGEKDKVDLLGADLEQDRTAADDGRGLIANAAPPAGLAPETRPMGGAAPMQQQGQMAYGSGSGAGGSAFEGAMTDYKNQRFDEATRRFDTLAPADANAALWAARSVKESNGCGAAVSRFDQVASRAGDTAVGYEATLEAARCYKTLGNIEAARARFARLAGVPAYATRAQGELDALSPSAASRAMTKGALPAKPAPAATATGTAPATTDAKATQTY